MIPGLKFAEEVMTAEEEADLIALMEASGLVQFKHDPGNPRCSKSFGWKYDFFGDTFVPCDPMPAGFHRIARTAADFAGVEVADLAECLLNRYDVGAYIQPHQDKSCWTYVIGVSLGAPVTMGLTHEAEGVRIDLELPRRSMYLLSGDARHVWQHSLPVMTETRWSITFRTFSEEGLTMRDRVVAAA